MSFINLTQKVLMNAVSASAVGAWYPVDWVYSGEQFRSIFGTKAADDIVYLECKISANVSDTATGVAVIATATTWGSAATGAFSCVLICACTHVRIRKEGTHGGVTAVGLL